MHYQVTLHGQSLSLILLSESVTHPVVLDTCPMIKGRMPRACMCIMLYPGTCLSSIGTNGLVFNSFRA
jgi:hypothetical protein